MVRSALVVGFLAFILVGVAPALAQSPTAPRAWTQLDGTVESVEATRLTLKTDLGTRLRVDISAMSTVERKDLSRGRRVSLIGYTAPRSGEFMAWFAPGEREEAAVQASPPTTPASTPAPIPVPSRSSR